MRIDDLNRALQTQETAKADPADSSRTPASGNSTSGSNSDAASISPLAANALDPALDASSAQTREARLQMLRLLVQRGEYDVSSEEIAASIIDQHIIG